MDTPATELAAVVTDQQTNTVSQSSQLTSKADDEQELPMGLETSGAPSMEHKPANKKPKSSGKSGEGRECRCALLRRLEADISQSEEASPWSATESAANSGTAEEDHTPSSRAETSQKGAGGDGHMVREAFQAATLFEKLPFELICEVSHVVQRQTSRWILPDCPRGLQVFSYLDLSNLIHVMRVWPFLNALLLAPNAQTIWARSRRNAGYVLFPGMSETNFALAMEGTLCQASFPHRPLRPFLPRPDNGLYAVLRRPRGFRAEVAGPFLPRLQAAAVRFNERQQNFSDHADMPCTARRVGPKSKLTRFHTASLLCVERKKSRRQSSPAPFAEYHPHVLRTLLTLLLSAQSNSYNYLYEELETVNQALQKAQAADDAEKAARLATGLPETAEHTSHVQRYVADRNSLLADRRKVS